MITFRAALVLACLLTPLGATSARAHESWVEPTSFRVEQGRRLPVRVCVADGFEGWSLARDPWRIAKFVAIGPAREIPVVGLDGSDPAGVVRLSEPGDYVIVYHSNRMFLEVPPAEFDAFLREKGLERVHSNRGRHRSPGTKTSEAYARHSKALVRVGGAAGRPTDRQVGLGLELVLESDRSGAGDSWTFRLLHRGRPLAGALVVATRLGTANDEFNVRTGDDGRARFEIRDPGLWRVASVHMIQAPRGIEAEWESLWTSLTFEIVTEVGEAAPSRITAPEACRNRLPPKSMSVRTWRQ